MHAPRYLGSRMRRVRRARALLYARKWSTARSATAAASFWIRHVWAAVAAARSNCRRKHCAPNAPRIVRAVRRSFGERNYWSQCRSAEWLEHTRTRELRIRFKLRTAFRLGGNRYGSSNVVPSARLQMPAGSEVRCRRK